MSEAEQRRIAEEMAAKIRERLQAQMQMRFTFWLFRSIIINYKSPQEIYYYHSFFSLSMSLSQNPLKHALPLKYAYILFWTWLNGFVKICVPQWSTTLLIEIPLHNLHRARENAGTMYSLQIHHLFQSCQKDRRQMPILQAITLRVLTIKILGWNCGTG